MYIGDTETKSLPSELAAMPILNLLLVCVQNNEAPSHFCSIYSSGIVYCNILLERVDNESPASIHFLEPWYLLSAALLRQGKLKIFYRDLESGEDKNVQILECLFENEKQNFLYEAAFNQGHIQLPLFFEPHSLERTLLLVKVIYFYFEKNRFAHANPDQSERIQCQSKSHLQKRLLELREQLVEFDPQFRMALLATKFYLSAILHFYKSTKRLKILHSCYPAIPLLQTKF